VRLSPAQDIYASQLAELLLRRAESAPRDENSRPPVLTTDPGVVALLQQAVSALEAVDGETPRDDPEPTNPFTIALHARALDQLLDAQGLSSPGARDNALAFAEQAARMTPARVSLKDSAARIALLNGDPTSALRLYNEAALLDPTQPQRMAEIGHAYRAQGSLAEAQRWYEDALRRDEETAEAWWGLAQLLVDRGDWLGALDPASRAARYQMRDWRFRRDLGRVYRELGQMTSARQELRAAARLCPSWHWPALSAEADALGPGS
jgi:tetratricopeptide (TPR) repeat protein